MARLNIHELVILEWSLQLPVHNILETVVGDDMMMGAIVLYRNGLLHQPAFLELITVDERTAESTLLIRRETLSKVGIHFFAGCILGRYVLKGRIFVLIVCIVDVLSSVGDRWAGAFLSLAFGTTRRVEC